MRVAFLVCMVGMSLVVSTAATGCEVSIGEPFDSGIDFGDGDGDGDTTDEDSGVGDGDGDGDVSGDGDTTGDGDGDGDSTGDGDGDGDGDSTVTPEQLLTELAKATCDAKEACVGYARLSVRSGYANCDTLDAARLGETTLSFLVDSIADGRVSFDAGKAAQCFADIGAQGCAWQSSRPPASCKEALAGTVAPGGDCETSYDCTGDAFCPPTDCVARVCTARVAEDGACNGTDQCQDGLVCVGAAGSAKCVPALPVDASCEAAGAQCQWGLVCLDPDGSGFRCMPESAEYSLSDGVACNADPQVSTLCKNDSTAQLYCKADAIDVTTGVCSPLLAQGAPCVVGKPDPCPDEQFCLPEEADMITGTCVQRAQSGDDCDSRWEKGCEAGLVCEDSTCVPRSRGGQDCETDARCYGGVCSLATFTCQAPLQCLGD